MNVSGSPPYRDSVDLRTSSSGSCPPSSVWRQVMTELPGDTTGERAAALLSHASICPVCSPLLARAIANSPGVPTEMEAAWLDSLPSSTPEGQQRLAHAMFRAASGEPRAATLRMPSPVPPSFWNWFGWRTIGLGVAAALLLCASLWFVLRKPSDGQLLAAAYDQHRLTELRLGDGHAVALESPTRGAAVDTSSTQLLEVKLRTQQRLEANPNDAAVRQTLGRIALVEHDGPAAIRHFEMAQALSPELPGLDLDLASAYFEVAESTNQATSYARSIDYFGKHLQQVHNKDAAALFNRGLAWERQAVYTEAIKDFESALALEKNAGWRTEIERHLQAVRSRSSEYGHPEPPSSTLAPASLLAQTAEARGDYEVYLFVASRLWLPRRAEDPTSAAALHKLAQWGEGHHDAWLADMLRTIPTGKEADAERMLAKALEATKRGDADATLEAATAASSLFKAVGNKAGVARADTEVIYAQHRRSQAEDCLQRAHSLDQAHALATYSTLQLYEQLEVASCLAMQQDMSGSLAAITKVALAAREYALPITRLRALGFSSEANNDLHESALAWQTGVEALAEAEQIHDAVYRRYQILFGMKSVATRLGLQWTTAGLSDAAATAAARSESLQVRAYALEQLGLDQARIGDDPAAIKSFAAADAVLTRLPAGPTKDIYLADWNTNRAPFRTRQANSLSGVLSDFAHAEPRYQAIDSYRTKLDYYVEYADLLLKAHRSDEALSRGWYAVQQVETAQRNSASTASREGAAEIASPAYLDVVRAYLQQNKPEEALRAWMWFQAAPYRIATTATGQPQLPTLPATAPGRLTLVYARLGDGADARYTAWALVSGKLVRTAGIAQPATQIENRGATLLRLCADPKSSQRDLKVLGENLYAGLLAPFSDLIQQASIVQFELDPALATLPFAALQHNGVYLGLERPLLFYSAGWSEVDPHLREAITDQEQLPSAAHLLVLRQAPPADQALIPGVYDESADVAKSFAHAQQREATVWRTGIDLLLAGDASLRSSLPQADLLHYTGHGLSGSSRASLKPANTFALGPRSLPHCRLAVLAACESFHERENSDYDVPSFARILLRAGASHVLATQWDVDSRSTRELMVRFYAELANHQPSPQALLRAQQSLYHQAGSAHPYFWSPFQIVAQ